MDVVGTGARRMAWVVVALLGGALCYSIGFQLGWSQGTASANGRYKVVTDSLHEILRAQEEPRVGESAAATAG